MLMMSLADTQLSDRISSSDVMLCYVMCATDENYSEVYLAHMLLFNDFVY
jgi:hypothetical protein